MNNQPYTCTEYREEMILMALKKRLADKKLSPGEREALLKEIEDLEELKDGEVDKNLSSQMMIINDQPMPNKLILDLTKEKLNLEKQLEFLATYNVIQPYYIPKNSTKKTKERTLMFSLIGLVLGFFVSLGHAIYLGLKSYEKKYH